jgi:cyclase
MNTSAVKCPELIDEASAKFGSQCIVVAIDAKKKDKSWEVYIHGGRTPTDMDAVAWAKEAAGRGAGEILLTSMDCDGTRDGYDLGLTKAVTQAVTIPVIASGGAGKPEHFYEVLTSAQADAALAASLFHYGELSVKELKTYLHAQKVAVRMQ